MVVIAWLPGLPISPQLQLLTTLRYLSTGNFQLTIGDCTDMSQPSVSKIVSNVSVVIANLAADYIQFPNPATEKNEMRKFFTTGGMPGIIGCVDGTHVPIKSPGGPNAEIYRCRKGFFSINVMGVCDAELKFTSLVVNWPGSAHDSRIFLSSRLCQSLEGGDYKGYLLGDSGYGCQTFLMTSVLAPTSIRERNYKEAHIKTRNVIKRAFGVWKKRFAVLSIPVRTKIETTKNIIISCAVLHNIAIMNRLPLPDQDGIEIGVPEMPGGQDDRVHNNRACLARRAAIIERLF